MEDVWNVERQMSLARCLPWVPWVVAFVSLSLFCVLALVVGWPGTFAAAGGGFCEAFREGPIKQPSNTWSNLGFVVAGLWVVRRAGIDRKSTVRSSNLIGRSVFLSTLYPALVVFLGPGSMAMHGSGTAWGATTDVLSMLLYIAFPVVYALRDWLGEARALVFSSTWLWQGGLGCRCSPERCLFPVARYTPGSFQRLLGLRYACIFGTPP